jgi:hypothetical protein
MTRIICALVALLAIPEIAAADEVFVTIQGVQGRTILVAETPARGPGMAPGGGAAGGFGRGRPGGAAKTLTLTIADDVKITSAMRERRTFEFRAGVELPGGLRNKVFQHIGSGLQARIVTDGTKITEINVITSETDINHSNINAADGQTVIAVRPKRPPMKK